MKSLKGGSHHPFARELVTDMRGEVQKVILDFNVYQQLLEAIEDAGLYSAIRKVKREKSLTREEAMAELQSK